MLVHASKEILLQVQPAQTSAEILIQTGPLLQGNAMKEQTALMVLIMQAASPVDQTVVNGLLINIVMTHAMLTVMAIPGQKKQMANVSLNALTV
jgi:hypothetical protein